MDETILFYTTSCNSIEGEGHPEGECNNHLLWGIFNNQLNKNRFLARTRDDEDTDVVRTTWHYTTINLTSTRDITRGQ